MRIHNLEQKSTEWLEFRKSHVTSTEASIINGTNRFSTSFKLWQQKLGLCELDPVNEKMIEGSLLESEAMEWYNKTHNTNFQPLVATSDEHQWAMASLDGYDENEDHIIEIKCGINSYEKARNGDVAPYYFDQVQHAMHVVEKTKCKMVFYRPEFEPIIIDVVADSLYTKDMHKKCFNFYQCLISKDPTDLNKYNAKGVEVQMVDKADSNNFGKTWIKAKKNLDIAVELEKLARADLVNSVDKTSCFMPSVGIKIEKIKKTGAVDYKKMTQHYSISTEDVEKYRKASLEYIKISFKELDTL